MTFFFVFLFDAIDTDAVAEMLRAKDLTGGKSGEQKKQKHKSVFSPEGFLATPY